VHSDAPALVRNIGGDPHFGKFQWVLFPPRPRPFSFVYRRPQFLPGMSSGVFEVGESSKEVGPKERVVVYR
jgi:hypothetical protein